MARPSKSPRLDLCEALSQHTYHNAVLCTYTFDPQFFENYCLKQFNALSLNGNISVCTDRGVYQKVALAPESQRPKQANLRYLFCPIDTRGRFHAKLFLLTTKASGRLIVGSANLTRAGLTSNAELVDVFDFEKDAAEETLPLFQDALAFLDAIAGNGQSESLASNLGELRRTTPWLDMPSSPRSGPVRLLHNLERPLWDQIVALAPRPMERMHVVSRFFDESPTLIDRVMSDLAPGHLCLYTQNELTTMTSAWLSHPLIRSGLVEAFLCSYEDDGHWQPLHAKAIVLESEQTSMLAYGSANFTSPALLACGRAGNIETVVVSDIPATVEARRFVDPAGSAYRLRSPDQLKTAKRDEVEHSPSMPVRLAEAVLNGNKIDLRVNLRAAIVEGELTARVHIQGTQGLVLPIARLSDERLQGEIPEKIVPRLHEASTLVGLENANGQEQLSNLVFVANLLDIKTNNSVRQERHIREAAQSAAQFFSVLNDLLRAGDENAILTFLNFCDIPLVNAQRASAVKGRPIWQGQEGMRRLGERNLEICKTLHDATLRFFERHFRKLRRHTEALMIGGVSNFLHIFLSMGGLLRTQTERIVIGLEARSFDAPAQLWGECRDMWDVYFLKFRELMECLWDQYLQPLSLDCTREDLRQEFGQDLDALHELCDAMIRYRERIEQVRIEKCVSREPSGRKIPFGYFRSVLEPIGWKRYAGGVQGRLLRIDEAVLGRAHHQPAPLHI